VAKAGECKWKAEDTFTVEKPKLKIMYVVPHFHFDLAWQKTESEYLDWGASLLAQYVVKALKEPEFKYIIDQVPLIEHFMSKYPRLVNAFKKQVREGQAEIVGALYVQPTVNLISGESYIRQIIYGQDFYERNFNIRAKHQWNIDLTMTTIQEPQMMVLGGLIARFHGWGNRGGAPFYWKSPDKSEVYYYEILPYPIRHKNGYGNADTFGETDDMSFEFKKVEGLFKLYEKTTNISSYLAMNGNDFTPPKPYIVQLVNEWNKKHLYRKMKIATISEYIEAVEKEKELLDTLQMDKFYTIISSRVFLKQDNRKAENALTNAEKINSVSCLLGLSENKSFQREWECLLKNQFHDTIVGVAINKAYDLVKKRFSAIFQNTQNSIKKDLQKISLQIQPKQQVDKQLILFNPLNWEREEPVKINLNFGSYVNNFKIIDENSNEIPYQIIDNRITGGSSNFTILMNVKLPSFGYKVLYIVKNKKPAVNPFENKKQTYNVFEIENSYLKVMFKGGEIVKLFNKETGKQLINSRNTIRQKTGRKLTHVHIDGKDVTLHEIFPNKPENSTFIIPYISFNVENKPIDRIEILGAFLLALTGKRGEEEESIDLNDNFNFDIISFDSNRNDLSPLGLERKKVGLPAEELEQTIVVSNGIHFNLGNFSDGNNNAVSPKTPISLHNKSFDELHLLCMPVGTKILIIKIFYQDGSYKEIYGLLSPFSDFRGCYVDTIKNANELFVTKDTDSGYGFHPISTLEEDSIIARSSEAPQDTVVYEGPIATRIVNSFRLDESIINREIIVYNNTRRIDFETHVKWKGSQKRLTVFFPFYDSRFKTIVSGNNYIRESTSCEYLSVKQWLDYGNNNQGIGIFHEGVLGDLLLDGVFGIVLIRGTYAINNDPIDHQGSFDFRYSIYPHENSWKNSKVYQKGLEFDNPVIYLMTDIGKGALPPQKSFLETSDNLILHAFYPTEDNSFIVRFVNQFNEYIESSISFKTEQSVPTKLVNFLRDPIKLIGSSNNIKYFTKPQEIITLELKFPHNNP